MTRLSQARREFLRRESPWAIGAGIVVLAVIRALVGDVAWRDAVAVAAMLAVNPFRELVVALPFTDRVLGTNPDQRDVPNSQTAWSLDPVAASGSG